MRVGRERKTDHRVTTCESAAEARAAVAAALRILNELGVQLHPQKTRIVHVRQGFEFLGYKIKRGKQLRLPGKIRSGSRGRCTLFLARNRSGVLWIRYARLPGGVFRSRPRS